MHCTIYSTQGCTEATVKIIPTLATKECSSGGVPITHEELQQRLNVLDTRSIIRKLVAYRRKEVAEKGSGNVYLLRSQLKEMKSQIKSLRKKVSSLRTVERE